MFDEKIWIVDQARLSQELIEAFDKGLVTIRDGVAYWAKGSGGKGIIQHLPFKEMPYESLEKAIQAAQMTTVITSVVSTGIILGAIAVQTKYLSAKLDSIRKTVDLIAEEVHSQQIVFYMDKISQYVGHLETIRTLLHDRSIAHEISGIAEHLLASTAVQRNQILSFVDNILGLAQSQDVTSPKHSELIVKFVNMVVGMLPFGIHLEHLLSARIGKINLADCILLDGATRYTAVIDRYKRMLNKWHQDAVAGKLGDRMGAYKAIEFEAEKLFANTIQLQASLLTLPMNKQVEPFSLEAAA